MRIGGGRVMGARDETTAEADSTFDIPDFISNRRYHSSPKESQLNIRKLHSVRNSTSGDDLKRHKTRDRKFSIANRRASSYSDQREEGRNEKEEEESERSLKNRKMLLRDWLLKQANDNTIFGLRWIKEEDGGKLLRIPWVHESKASWTPDDSQVFEEWAKHTGKLIKHR